MTGIREKMAAAKKKLSRGKAKTASRRARKSARPTVWRHGWFRAGALGLIWCVFAAGLFLAWYAHDLPDTDKLGAQTRRPSVTLATPEGRIIASYGDLYGEPLGLHDLPKHLVEATLATEDRRFYDHWGVDVWGVVRAVVANVWYGEIRQGGSTLTQQLAKNLFLTPERTLKRKVQETMLAIWLERRFTKDELLTIYLNRVYFGAGTYGIDAAARKFFGKSARDLSLYESAMLVGLVKAPSRYNPANDPATAKARADQVLINMMDAGYLTEEQTARGYAPPKFREPEVRKGELYFADWVLEEVGEHVGFTDRDLYVVTTLDTPLQEMAQAELAATLSRESGEFGIGQAAMVAMAPDGAVKAMVGGVDYGQSQFNRAAQALRQPGSAFKLFVYLAGLQAGLTPDSVLNDGPIQVGKWRPTNYTGGYRGPMTLREALMRSTNTIAVQVSEKAGRERVIENARMLGLTTPLKPEPSIALGSHEVRLVELTAAYAALANGGHPAPAHGILEIRDRDGGILYRHPGLGPRTIPLWQVGAMNDMLGAVIDQGTGRNAQIDRPAAGKTGTSQDWRDAWFVGYTADLVVGVWSGNDDNTPMNKVAGGHFPARLWGGFMTKALDGVAVAGLPGLTSYNRRVAANAPAAPLPANVPNNVVPTAPPRPSVPAPVGTAEAAEPALAAEESSEVFKGPTSTQGIFAR